MMNQQAEGKAIPGSYGLPNKNAMNQNQLAPMKNRSDIQNRSIDPDLKQPPLTNGSNYQKRMVSPEDLKLPDTITKGKKIKPEKYMVLQMGQDGDESTDKAIIQYLSQNALAIQHHPGAVQF